MINEEDGTILQCFPAAFERREGEGYLSATWIEFFDGSSQERVDAAARCTKLEVKAKDGFALCNVGTLKAISLDFGARIRVVHEPDGDNEAHAAIRQLPNDNQALLAAIAQRGCVAIYRPHEICKQPLRDH
jgi:hypothetical protein